LTTRAYLGGLNRFLLFLGNYRRLFRGLTTHFTLSAIGAVLMFIPLYHFVEGTSEWHLSVRLLYVLGLVITGIPNLINVALVSTFLIAAMILPVVCFIVAAAAIALGWDAVLTAAFYQTTAESQPHGTWQVKQFETTIPYGMNHSAAYDDPAAVDAIVSWVLQTAEGEAPKI
jgi:uncharacterized membrane protein